MLFFSVAHTTVGGKFHVGSRELLHLTLNDTFSLLGNLVTAEMAIQPGIDLLGLSYMDCVIETNQNRGPYFKFTFLEDAYGGHLGLGNVVFAARAYLLLLLGYTISADYICTSEVATLFKSCEECG